MTGRDRERLQALAAKGARERMTELLEEIVELKQTLPHLLPLASVQAALSATIDAIDDGPRGRRSAPTRSSETNGARARKPKERKRAATATITSEVRLRSWLAGRDVLAMLDHRNGEAAVPEIAKALKITDGAAYQRLVVRAKHGHARLINADERTWGITTEGRTALRNDQDSEL